MHLFRCKTGARVPIRGGVPVQQSDKVKKIDFLDGNPPPPQARPGNRGAPQTGGSRREALPEAARGRSCPLRSRRAILGLAP